jgi:hypothetical protein
VRATVLLVVLCSGCAHVSSGAATALTFTAVAAVVQVLATPTLEARNEVCPEYRSIRCARTPSCSRDERLGCDVCRCPALMEGSVVLWPDSGYPGLFSWAPLPPPPWIPPSR